MRTVLLGLGLLLIAAISALSLSFSAASAAPEATTLEHAAGAPDTLFTPASHPGDRVCCKRGRNDWWTTRRACWRSGGYAVSARHCRNDWNEVRVCCKRGRYDWWTTPRACARSGGYRVSGWQCRNG